MSDISDIFSDSGDGVFSDIFGGLGDFTSSTLGGLGDIFGTLTKNAGTIGSGIASVISSQKADKVAEAQATASATATQNTIKTIALYGGLLLGAGFLLIWASKALK